MANFICTNCKYRFKAGNADRCPYCDKKAIEQEKSASELLNEVEILLQD